MNSLLFGRNNLIRRWSRDHLPLESNLGDLEGAYRDLNLQTDITQLKILISLGIGFILIYALIDYQLFGYSSTLLGLYLVRGIFIGITAVIALNLRHASYLRFDKLALTWVMAMACTMLYINTTRTASFFYNSVVDLVILIAFYTALPIPLSHRLAPSILLSLGEITLLLFFRQGINPIGIRSMIIGIVLANIIGILISIRSNSYRRDQFIAQYEEREAREEIERLAVTDVLTGVLNRRRFEELAEKEFSRFCRYKYPLSLMVIDLDDLKHIHDRYGHLGGDQVLRQLGKLFISCTRKNDLVGRLGGDEFALLLPEANGEKAVEIGERLRRNCEQEVILTAQGLIHTTVSIGVSHGLATDRSFDQLFQRADEALFEAKQRGRNRVNTMNEGMKYAPSDESRQSGNSQLAAG